MDNFRIAQGRDSTQNHELNDFWLLLIRRRWVIFSAISICTILATLWMMSQKHIFRSTTLIIIEKERGGGEAQGQSAYYVDSRNDDYYQTQYRLLRSYSLLEKVYISLRLDETSDFKPPNGIEKLQSAIGIAPVPRSRLVNINADTMSPELSQRIADTVAQTFVDQNLENQLFISQDILKTLQLDGASLDADSLPSVVSNPLIQSLKSELAKLEAQHADMARQFTPKHPAMLSAEANLLSLRDRISLETKRVVQSMRAELSGHLKGNNVRIVDRARKPLKPVRPRRALGILSGACIGALLGVLLALVLNSLDQTIRSEADVSQWLATPFLGVIPFSAELKHKAIVTVGPNELNSLTAEAFRNLRTMIDLATPGERTKILLITSSMQEEGKTHVSTNLAAAIAHMGEKTLLIDGDLRRPQIHRAFEVSRERGLSNFLAGTESVDILPSMIAKSDVPQLFVLPCGPRPPNPAELLNTPRVAALLAWASQEYDRVIVDCPPMFPISDSLLWARHIPHAAFVVKAGITRTPLIISAIQKLTAGRIGIIGVILNNTKATSLSYAQHGYYYQQYYQAYHQQETTPSRQGS